MKTLIFTVGWADLYFELACMFAHSCRVHGYTQDLIIFSTQDGSSAYAEIVNVSRHPERDLLRTGTGHAFHGLVPRTLGYQCYRGELDFFMIKTLPGSFIQRQDYDFILYCDSDILVRRPLTPIWEFRSLVGGYSRHSYYRALKGLAALLTAAEAEEAKTMRCVGSGVIGVPQSLYGFFDDFRNVYLAHRKRIAHDGPAVSLAAFRGRVLYRPTQLEKSYFSHYWGAASRKQQMIEDYRRDFLRPS